MNDGSAAVTQPKTITIETHGAIEILTLDRPDQRNAVTPDMITIDVNRVQGNGYNTPCWYAQNVLSMPLCRDEADAWVRLPRCAVMMTSSHAEIRAPFR